MSIEKIIEANTAALIALTAALDQIVTVKLSPTGQPKTPAPVAAGAPAAKPETPGALTFEALKQHFLKLVAANRPAAIALLAKFSLKGLSEAKPEAYPQIEAELKASGV